MGVQPVEVKAEAHLTVTPKLAALMGIKDEEFVIEYRTPHSKYIEFGTGPAAGHAPYMPPIEPLVEWVEKKFGYSGKKAMRIARAVQFNILLAGTAPHPFARPAVSDCVTVIPQLVDDAIEKGSLGQAIADYIAERSKEYIIQGSQTVDGTLLREIYVVKTEVE